MPSRRESPRQKAERAYVFLAEAASTHCPFTLEEFSARSGYTIGTAKMYLSKKWHWFSEKQGDGRYQIKDQFLEYSLDAFKKDLRQKVPSPLMEPPVTSDRLLVFRFSIPTTLAFISFLLAWAFTLHILRKHTWWLMPI